MSHSTVTDEATSKQARFSLRWTPEEDDRLRQGVELWPCKSWKRVAEVVQTRDADACQQRWHRGIRPDLIKGKWTKEEDHLLIELVSCGCSNWGVIAAAMESRTPKQCRERWTNYLDPTVNHEKFTAAEDTQLIALQNIHGNRWAEIARCLPGRTETAVKLRFNSLFRQRERIEQEQKIREQITLAQGGGAVYGRQPQALQEESGEEQWNDHQSCDDQQSSNKRQRRS